MTAEIVVQPEAEADLAEAFRWYEARHPGLGHEMIGQTARVFARIAADPSGRPALYRDTRRIRLRRFPYLIAHNPQP